MGNNKLYDFIYQHLKKLYLETNEYEKAMQAFKEAYVIRVEKNDEELIISTDKAITFTQERLKEL